MTRTSHPDELFDLLAERATTGLDAAAAARLELLLAEAAEKEDHFELAAAALELAGPRAEEELPANVERRLRREARRFAAGLPPSSLQPAPVPFRPPAATEHAAAPASWRRSPAVPWLIAALFFFAALTGWWRVFLLSQQRASEPAGAVAAASPKRDPELARAALLAGQSPAAPVAFTGTQDPAAQGVSGDVVWSPERQLGYLRFQNLPNNDPKVYQYQLWIFDATRDERFPIDGGVFDVRAGEVVIPIEPALPVGQATLFAVTIEKPGGAVVSSRERIVVLAKVI